MTGAPPRVLAVRLDKAVVHLERFDAEGVELFVARPEGARWKPAGSGRRIELCPGLDVEVDTSESGSDFRVTLGPDVLWKRDADVDPVALASELLGGLRPTAAPLYRLDVAIDLECSTRYLIDSDELVELRALRDSLESKPEWNAAFGWSLEGCRELVIGKRGESLQLIIYDKPHPYHWPDLGRYVNEWDRHGYRGIGCACGRETQLGEVCRHCDRKAVPWAVLRCEFSYPRRWCEEANAASFNAARRWIADPPSQGRASVLSKLPARWHLGVLHYMARWSGATAPRQKRGQASTAAGIVRYHERRAARAQYESDRAVALAPPAERLAAEVAQLDERELAKTKTRRSKGRRR